MFREMRKVNHELDEMKCIEILKQENYGVLSVNGDNGYPYGVPISYIYEDGKLIMHSTNKNTHKIEALKQNNKVSFCVVSKANLMQEEYTVDYESVIAFGKATLIEDEGTKKELLKKFMLQLAPTRVDVIEKFGVNELLMIEIEIEHVSGKAKFI